VASAVAIMSIGMTLITSCCKGQDISVAAVAAIAGSVFVSVLRSREITIPVLIAAFLYSCLVSVLFSIFNGILVAVFRIQPMIATLILFSAGRSIAYWINGGATPTISNPLLAAVGGLFREYPFPHHHYNGYIPYPDFTGTEIYHTGIIYPGGRDK